MGETFRARKKPVEITFQVFDPGAKQWPEGVEPLHIEGLATGKPCEQCGQRLYSNVHGWVATLEGGHIACPTDRIITGVEGERYPCKAAIFEKTYEVVIVQVDTPVEEAK